MAVQLLDRPRGLLDDVDSIASLWKNQQRGQVNPFVGRELEGPRYPTGSKVEVVTRVERVGVEEQPLDPRSLFVIVSYDLDLVETLTDDLPYVFPVRSPHVDGHARDASTSP